MRSFFASLMPPNLPPLLLLPRPVMPLPILHTLLVHGFSIPVHLIICMVIRISSLLLLSLHPYLRLLWLMGLNHGQRNLISISKLINDLNCSITFSHSYVTLQDRNTTKRTIGIRHESQGLYHLSSTPSSTVCTSTDEPRLVHRRLGHLNISKLWKMVSRFSSLSSLECELCQLGKNTRVSFPKRLKSRTNSPFELVHTNV